MTIQTNKQLISLLIIKAAILLAAVLIPFALRAERYYFVGSYSGPEISCQAGSVLSPVNQCIAWETSTWKRTAIVATGALALAAISFISLHPIKQQWNKWIKWEVIFSLATLLIMATSYWLMRTNSQGVDFGRADQLPNGQWTADNPVFGVGIAGIVVLMLALLFSLQPLQHIYTIYISKKHVGGQKKRELFQ